MTCVNEIRKYIYGRLSEDDISTFITQGTTIPPLRGFAGFCALVNDVSQFRELDGWMLDTLRRALNERYKRIAIVAGTPGRLVPSPESLINGNWHSSALNMDVRLPSFVRSWRASRKRFKLHGLEGLRNPSYYADFADVNAFFYEL